jgi:hypothetical protein
MKSRLLFHEKVEESDGGIVEVKIWEVSTTKSKPHGYRYSLAYVRNGKLLVCYDNHTGKGDQRHYQEGEEAYKFSTVSKLIENFYRDIRRMKDHEG